MYHEHTSRIDVGRSMETICVWCTITQILMLCLHQLRALSSLFVNDILHTYIYILCTICVLIVADTDVEDNMKTQLERSIERIMCIFMFIHM